MINQIFIAKMFNYIKSSYFNKHVYDMVIKNAHLIKPTLKYEHIYYKASSKPQINLYNRVKQRK